ncbi:MAG: AAA family ATPase [bacterium]|nr:AAA family ATPase [bacterium]
MQIHQVRGRNLREALERARSQIGDKAVVISHSSQVGGAVTLVVSDEVPRSAGALEALRSQARRVLAAPQRAGAGAPLLADTRDVERCMHRTGCSDRLVDRIAEAVAGRLAEDKHPLDLAAEELSDVFPVAHLEHKRGQTTVLAFVGPAGVGKTTTLAKLALRLRRAGRRVSLATLDATRIGAIEELRGYGTLLGCPALALDAAARVLNPDQVWGAEVVLLDTSGTDARDMESIQDLATHAARANVRVDVYRVVSATSSISALEAAAEACSGLKLSGCIITKLDETHQPVTALEHAVHEKLPIAFLSDGPDLERHLHRGTGEAFADLVLRGRVA